MGRVYQATYTSKDENGNRVTKQAPGWYIEYTDNAGKTRHRKAGAMKEQARDALKQAESEVLKTKNGLPTQSASDIVLSKLVEAYLTAQEPHVTQQHHAHQKQWLTAVLTGTRAVTLRDLKPETVESFLATLDTVSARTVNCHLITVKALLNWAVKSRLIPFNPLDCLSKRPEYFKVRNRRAMSEDELGRLLTAAADGPMRRAGKAYRGGAIPLEIQAKLAEQGRRNVLIYRLLVLTGLRVNEARSLTWADIDMQNATLTTRPEWTGNKNGKAETLPLAPGLVTLLSEWKARHPAPDTAHAVKLPAGFVRTMAEDLEAAGMAKRVPFDKNRKQIPLNAEGKPAQRPYKWKLDTRDAAGRVIDLHALRHTCGTRLVATGADIKTVQALMRHATPSMTLGIYVHKDKRRMADAVASLPDIEAKPLKAEAVAMLKTGTDNRDELPDNDRKIRAMPTSNQQGKNSNNGKAIASKELALPKESAFQAI